MTGSEKGKWTPGPWTFSASPIDGAHDNQRVTVAVEPDSMGRQAQIGDIFNEANARLIAAAPELVEALRQMVEEVESLEAALRHEHGDFPPTGATDKAKSLLSSLSGEAGK